jgi:hypothetical protein
MMPDGVALCDVEDDCVALYHALVDLSPIIVLTWPLIQQPSLGTEGTRGCCMLGLPASGPSHNLRVGVPLRAVHEDIEREWAGRLAAEEAKRKEANEWATELAHVLEKEKKVCPLAVSKKCSQEQGMGMDLYNSSPVARAIWDSANTHLISAY